MREADGVIPDPGKCGRLGRWVYPHQSREKLHYVQAAQPFVFLKRFGIVGSYNASLG
jgi:hypothetical protein